MGARVLLNVDELELSPWNPRFDPVENEIQAITEMLRSQKNKLIKLAENIAKNGLNPSNALIVSDSKNFPGKKIVCEGNRRVTAIKLVLQPTLIPDEFTRAKVVFESLNERYSESIQTEIACYYTNDREEINHLLKLIHTGQQGGIGTVSWGSIEIDRFNKHEHGETMHPGQQLLEFLREQGILESKINKSDLAVTNLTRLLSTPHVREKLGITGKGAYLNFSSMDADRVVALMQDISRDDFSVKEIYSADDRVKYIDSLFDNSSKNDFMPTTPRIDFEADQERQDEHHKDAVTNLEEKATNTSSCENESQNRIRRGAPTQRTHLIPQGALISVSDARVKRIYDELRSLYIPDFTNATAVLLRTFIELSCDCYLLKYEQNYDDKVTLSNKMKVTSKGLNYLGLIDDGCLQAISRLRNEQKDNECLNVATLHAFVHSRSYNPNAGDLIAIWDNVEPFMRALWNRIHDEN